MKIKHIYSFTYTACSGDIVTGEWEVKIKYTFSPGTPARINYNENDHPAEAPEIEIEDVLVEDCIEPGCRNHVWRKATEDEFETFSEYALDKRFDEMVEEASEDLEGSEDAAREHAAECREELRREGIK